MNRFFLIIAVIILSACAHEPYFEKNVSLKNNKWEQDEIIRIEIDIPKPQLVFDFYINMRNTKSYGYSNLYMFLDITDPKGEKWSDTLEFRVAESDGRWTGDYESSESFVMNSWLTIEKFKFPKQGTYIFEMRHGMYDDALPEVTDIGIRLEEIK